MPGTRKTSKKSSPKKSRAKDAAFRKALGKNMAETARDIATEGQKTLNAAARAKGARRRRLTEKGFKLLKQAMRLSYGMTADLFSKAKWRMPRTKRKAAT